MLSSHDMAEVEELCTTLTVINQGRVVYAGRVDEMTRLAPSAVHALRTSDDHVALDVGCRHAAVKVAVGSDGGLEVSAEPDALDAYVISLGRAGIAVRALERRARSLESLFFELTAKPASGESSMGTDSHASATRLNASLPPALAFTALAVVLSVATRSSIAGIGLPVLAGLTMQLLAFVDGPEVVRRLMVTSAFGAWHGLLAEPPYYRPLVHATIVSGAYFVFCLAFAYRMLQRRDIGG